VDSPARLTVSGAASLEAAIDRAMVEGYTRVPDHDEFDGLAEASLQILNEDDPW
jgi:hypothetical protein